MYKFVLTEDGDKLVVAHQEIECKLVNFEDMFNTYSFRGIIDVMYASGLQIEIVPCFFKISPRDPDELSNKHEIFSLFLGIPEKIVKAQLLAALIFTE